MPVNLPPISAWLRRFIPRPELASWRVTRAETFALADLLAGRADTAGRFVYVVFRGQCAVYVGQCIRSLRRRIREHRATGTALGVALDAAPGDAWDIDVFHIEGDLRAAEIYYIDRTEPPYNRQHRSVP